VFPPVGAAGAGVGAEAALSGCDGTVGCPAPGAGGADLAGTSLMSIPENSRILLFVRMKLVIKKQMAQMEVNFVKKLPAPLLPKIL